MGNYRFFGVKKVPNENFPMFKKKIIPLPAQPGKKKPRTLNPKKFPEEELVKRGGVSPTPRSKGGSPKKSCLKGGFPDPR